MKSYSLLLVYLLISCGIFLTFAEESQEENKNIQTDNDSEIAKKELLLDTELEN